MNRKNFGKLISALRRERLDRHNVMWTRQRFSMESGVDAEILANIETGRRAILYPELLLQLADALKLSVGERREFLFAASGVEDREIFAQPEESHNIMESMLAILDKSQLPSFIVDQYFDVVAVNPMAVEVYNIKVEDFVDKSVDPATRVNLLRFIFSPKFSRQQAMFGEALEDFYATIIGLFRVSTLRYRAEEYYENLLQHLCEMEELNRYLQRKPKDKGYLDGCACVNLNHPRLGQLRAALTAISAISAEGELKLFTLAPLTDETSKAFSKIVPVKNYVFKALPDWPRKDRVQKK